MAAQKVKEFISDAEMMALQAQSGKPEEFISDAKMAAMERTSRGASGSWQKPMTKGEKTFRAVMGPFATIGQEVVSAGKNVVRTPLTVMEAAGAPPQNESEELVRTGAGGLGLAAKRLLVDPQTELARKSREADTGMEAFGYGLASKIPILGPMAAHFGERLGRGEVLGSATEAATYAMAPRVISESARAAPAVVKAGAETAKAGAKAALNKANLTPEGLRLRAAKNREPVPASAMGASDVVATGIGALLGGPTGLLLTEGANVARKVLRRPYRNAKAMAQEALARRLAKNNLPPMVQDRPILFQGEPIMPPTRNPGPFRPTAERPMQVAEEAPTASPQTAPRPYEPPISQRYEPPLEEPGPFFANQKPPAARGADLPFELAQDMQGKIEIPRSRNPRIRMAEEAIAPSPRFRRWVDENTPELLRVAPEVDAVRKGPQWDAGLMQAFKRVEQGVDAADATVAPTVTVPKAELQQSLRSLAAEYKDRGLERTAAQIEREAAKWDDLPEQIPWPEFRNRKRAFFQENKASSSPVRRAYGILMQMSEQYSGSPILKQANRDYSIVRGAADAAGINLKTGRRLSTVGKPPKPPIK